jgi:hypothetical protein
VKEVSVILKDNTTLTVEEFRIIDRHLHYDKIRTLVHRPPESKPYIFTQRTVEYVFDIETLTMFLLVSQNVLAYWDATLTRHLRSNDEYHIRDYLFIRPFDK